MSLLKNQFNTSAKIWKIENGRIDKIKIKLFDKEYLCQIIEPEKPLIQSDVRCVHCQSYDITKYGKKYSKNKTTQIYVCKTCNRKFQGSYSGLYQYNKDLVLRAKELYKEGLSSRKISKKIYDEFKIKVTHTTALRWAKNNR